MGIAPSQLAPGFWQGGENTYEEDLDFFERNDVKAILSVCQTPAPDSLKDAGVENLFIDKRDSEETDLYPDFARAAEFLHAARCQGKTVYVHCACGISRATTMSCAYLMAHLGLSFDQALANVSHARSVVCPNDGFRNQLLRWEQSGDAAELGARLRERHGDALVMEDTAYLLGIWDLPPDAHGGKLREPGVMRHMPGAPVDAAQQKEFLRGYLQKFKDLGYKSGGSIGLGWLEEPDACARPPPPPGPPPPPTMELP